MSRTTKITLYRITATVERDGQSLWADNDGIGRGRRRAAWIEWARGAWRQAVSSLTRGGAFLHYVHVRFGDLDEDVEIAGHLPDDESRSWEG